MENFELVQELKLALIREYETLVPAVASLGGVSSDHAREAIHGAICRMFVSLQRRPPGNPVVAWRPFILRSAMNELRMEERRRSREVPFSQLSVARQRVLAQIPDPRPSPDEEAANRELAKVAWEEMENLPARACEVIRRRCHGQRFRQIARELNIEPHTAMAHYHFGITKLRSRLRGAA